MSKAHIHAESSARKFGGKMEDYLEIHEFLDSSKGAIPDNRHRALTHTSWFISTILTRIKWNNTKVDPSGLLILNSDNKVVHIRDIGEQHILEDYGMRFIPTPQDFLADLPFQDWMNNGKVGSPDSHQGTLPKKTQTQSNTSRDKIMVD